MPAPFGYGKIALHQTINNRDWCDCHDKITLDETFTREITLDKRKRIMHNIQDIGNEAKISVEKDEELIEDGFLAYEAWRRVIYTILMSGPFYLNVNNRE